MLKKVLACSLLTFVAVPTTALAGGYGPAGCGIGNLILGDDTTGLTAGIAMYINGAFYGPTSITLGLLDCGDGGVAALDTDELNYVVTNRDQLAEDSAKGAGDTVAALADLMSCDENFVDALQADHEAVFSGTDQQVYLSIQATCNAL
jgi:hypothetical protein